MSASSAVGGTESRRHGDGTAVLHHGRLHGRDVQHGSTADDRAVHVKDLGRDRLGGVPRLAVTSFTPEAGFTVEQDRKGRYPNPHGVPAGVPVQYGNRVYGDIYTLWDHNPYAHPRRYVEEDEFQDAQEDHFYDASDAMGMGDAESAYPSPEYFEAVRKRRSAPGYKKKKTTSKKRRRRSAATRITGNSTEITKTAQVAPAPPPPQVTAQKNSFGSFSDVSHLATGHHALGTRYSTSP